MKSLLQKNLITLKYINILIVIPDLLYLFIAYLLISLIFVCMINTVYKEMLSMGCKILQRDRIWNHSVLLQHIFASYFNLHSLSMNFIFQGKVMREKRIKGTICSRDEICLTFISYVKATANSQESLNLNVFRFIGIESIVIHYYSI